MLVMPGFAGMAASVINKLKEILTCTRHEYNLFALFLIP